MADYGALFTRSRVDDYDPTALGMSDKESKFLKDENKGRHPVSVSCTESQSLPVMVWISRLFFFIGGRGRALSAALTNEQCPNKTGRIGRQRSHAKPSVTSSKCLGWNTIQNKTRGSQSHKNTSTPVHALVRSTHKRRMGAERWREKGKTSHRLYKWPSTAREPQHSYGAASPVVLCSRASQNNSLQDVPVWSTWIRRRIWRLCLFSELHAWSHWARETLTRLLRRVRLNKDIWFTHWNFMLTFWKIDQSYNKHRGVLETFSKISSTRSQMPDCWL